VSDLLLFGASTPSGAAFCELGEGRSLTLLGRRALPASPQHHHLPCDLSDPDGFTGELPPGVAVSFAPIWHLAPFLAALAERRPNALAALRGVVACSSSSAITKRYATNHFDRELVQRLLRAEDLLQRTCAALAIPCRILAPTLIYGRVGEYGDRNLSQLLTLMRRLPLLPIPAKSGLRQPIHATQLAAVALHQALHLLHPGAPQPPVPPLLLGGDDTLSYTEMLRRLQQSIGRSDRASRCILLPLPPRLFPLLAAPLLVLSPKAFEAVQRIGADLAGFTPAHTILNEPPRRFPVAPLNPG
jgi:hypothetical protein